MEDLRDKVALVTGDAGGLGSAACRALAEAGAVVVVADFDPAQDVAAVVVGLFEGYMTGECWFVQPGRTGPFGFRNVPGPRLEPAA